MTTSSGVRDGPAPFHDNPTVVAERERVNYGIRISKEEALSHSAQRRVRVYADGVYDTFHWGHARQLMQVKRMLPGCYLIAGVTSDALTRRMKGPPLMEEAERYEAVRHCRYVDEVMYDAPWVATADFLEKYKIDFLAHDDAPYQGGGGEDVYRTVKECGMFLPTRRSDGISTTNVIGRVLRDCNRSHICNLRREVNSVEEKRQHIRETFESMKRKGGDIVRSIDLKRCWSTISVALLVLCGRNPHRLSNRHQLQARVVKPRLQSRPTRVRRPCDNRPNATS